MKLLVVGSGGREHALAWRLAASPEVTCVFVAPGNAGTALEPGCENVAIDALDLQSLGDFAEAQNVDLTVVGPEAPLVAGIRDHFDARGLPCFGPSAAAARLEGSKAFSKAFLARYRIPTAAYETFTDLAVALAYLATQPVPIVIKADGLAAGKGVVVAETQDQAESAVRDMLAGNAFGEAGHRVVIEEFLPGEEASFICLCDGERAIPFATSQDHKARDEGDRGPNTGGMGAYSPAPVIDEALHQQVMAEIIEPTLAGMVADGCPYQGFLYAGLMITAEGQPKVIEFNCRFGDPEAQPIMMRLRSDLALACQAAIGDGLAGVTLEFDRRVAVGVVLAAEGYPASYRKGMTIDALPEAADDLRVFHAGTVRRGEQTLTSGGRVLCVVGLHEQLAAAQSRAYEGVSAVAFEDCYFRRDIGHRALARAASASR